MERTGLLLETDPILPSVVSEVVGEPVRGSWWGHPRGNEIFNLASELFDHPDVITAKLLGGKVTYVHRRLWPALSGVATSQEIWQTGGLPFGARGILDQVRRSGPVRADDLPRTEGRSPSKHVGELEKRLLVHTFQVHTEGGHHVRVLQTWERWAAEAGITPSDAGEGKKVLETAFAGLRGAARTKLRLPWS